MNDRTTQHGNYLPTQKYKRGTGQVNRTITTEQVNTIAVPCYHEISFDIHTWHNTKTNMK